MSKRTVISAFLGGAVVGATSLFFAPKKGSELRKDAQAKLVEVTEKAKTTLEKYRNAENNEQDTNVIVEEVISEQIEEKEEDTIVDNPTK